MVCAPGFLFNLLIPKPARTITVVGTLSRAYDAYSPAASNTMSQNQEWLDYVANLIATHDVGANSTVLVNKLFHYDNLALRLIRDDFWLCYRIDILRINDKSTSDLWGMFDFGLFTEDEVRAKFESIRL